MGTHSRGESLEYEENPTVAAVSGHLVPLWQARTVWTQVEEVATLQNCVRNRMNQLLVDLNAPQFVARASPVPATGPLHLSTARSVG